MESRFQRPLDRVRIHEGDDADRWTRAGNATALTLGRHIAFSRGSFAPGTVAGRALIAHELAHAVQQATPNPTDWRWGGHDTPSEREAHAASAAVMAGQTPRLSAVAAGVIQRQPALKQPPAPDPDEPWWEKPAANDNVKVAAEEGAEEEGLGEGALELGGAGLAALGAGLLAFFWDEDEAGPEWGPEGPPKTQPRPDPRAKPEEPENKRGCRAAWVAREGGNTCHDRCAESISGVPLEYQVTTPEGVSVSFDAIDLTTTLYEVKTGYGYMLNRHPDSHLADQQQKTRESWLAQSQQQLVVAERCGYPLVWTFNEPAVAKYASGLIEPLTETIDCPCPKRTRRKRKPKTVSSKRKKSSKPATKKHP